MKAFLDKSNDTPMVALMKHRDEFVYSLVNLHRAVVSMEETLLMTSVRRIAAFDPILPSEAGIVPLRALPLRFRM